MAHISTMVLEVINLQCYQCYKKVKKVLCGFDQIKDQEYNEKENKVTIKVVCCDPEGMKQKILCRGKDVIKNIEIKVPKIAKPDGKPPKPDGKPPKPDGKPPPPPPPQGIPVPSVPLVPCVPVYLVPVAGTCFHRMCCQECHKGRHGGPCFQGHNYNFGGPPPCYDDRYNNNWGKPVINYDSCGGRERGNYFHPSQEYCSEPASGCQIM